MPIKDPSIYPPNWDEIRARILARAHNRCELCGAPNHAWIMRHRETPGMHFVLPVSERLPVRQVRERYPDNRVFSAAIRVVLTIAHLDHAGQCHRDECLLALCQRCHNKIDAHQRHVSREATLAAKRAKQKGDIPCD